LSDETWVFKNKNDLIYIENILTKKVLGSTNDGKVSPEDYEEGKAYQLWKKGDPDAEGYFTLANFGVPKVITAISESGLEIKGNITDNSEMDITSRLFDDYLTCNFFTNRSQ
jgi:hypothetical protein